MNINLVSKFLKSTHFLTIFMVFMFTIYSSLVVFEAPAFSSIFFKIGLFVVLAICCWSLTALTRKAFIHSKTVSVFIITLSSIFYINETFQIVPNIATQIAYTLFMGIWSLYLAMSVLSFKTEQYHIEDKNNFPDYDCLSINPFVEAYDFGQNPRDPLEYEFDMFTMFYKNCYASDGIVYCHGEECKLSQVISYLKDEKKEINELSKDDFKLISMIFI